MKSDMWKENKKGDKNMKTAYKSIIGIVLVCLLVSLLPVSVTRAHEVPEIEWEKTFGENGYDWGCSVQQTTDGGYIVVGNTGFGENSDIYLIKTDAKGNEVWRRKFGTPAYGERGYSV
ncbi:MAG: hypothetical protein QMD22_08775 [archaeon]|nr:hypothetical protein [archaeon]